MKTTEFQRKVLAVLKDTAGGASPAWIADRVWPVKGRKELLGQRRAKWQSMGGHLRRLEAIGLVRPGDPGCWYLTNAGRAFKL